MSDFVPLLIFLGVAGGLMSIVVGSMYAIKRINLRFPDDAQTQEHLAAMRERVDELEERLDVAKRLLTEMKGRQQIPPDTA